MHPLQMLESATVACVNATLAGEVQVASVTPIVLFVWIAVLQRPIPLKYAMEMESAYVGSANAEKPLVAEWYGYKLEGSHERKS